MHVRRLSLPGLEASSRRLSPCCGWKSACQTYLPGVIVVLATQETILKHHCASYRLQQLVSAVRQDMNGVDLSDQGKALVIISKHGRNILCPLSKYNVMIRSSCRCILQMCQTAQKAAGSGMPKQATGFKLPTGTGRCTAERPRLVEEKGWEGDKNSAINAML